MSAVRETLSLLQKLFPVRQCENSVCNSRSIDACLQYQIDRCLAPCVAGYVSDEGYNQQVDFSLFLQGKDQQVLDHLIKKIELTMLLD